MNSREPASKAFLTPAELGAAAAAFDAALAALPSQAFEVPPFIARQKVARSIIERALAGENDPSRLREAGVAAVAPTPPELRNREGDR